MRLIDADEFIKSLDEYINKPMTAGLCATLIELHPTAYDVEKVVECLEDFTEELKQHNADGILTDIIDTVRTGGIDTGWILQDERLPDENVDVLIQFDNGKTAVGCIKEINYLEYQWFVNVDKNEIRGTMETVEKWRPLPAI